MSTILNTAPAHAWLARTAAQSLWGTDMSDVASSRIAGDADRSGHFADAVYTDRAPLAERSAVLTLSRVPKSMRMHVERALTVCLRSEPAEATPGMDPLMADWFMRWSRDRSVTDYYAVRCRQELSGTEAEFAALERVLAGLAAEHGFYASVRVVD